MRQTVESQRASEMAEPGADGVRGGERHRGGLQRVNGEKNGDIRNTLNNKYFLNITY